MGIYLKNISKNKVYVYSLQKELIPGEVVYVENDEKALDLLSIYNGVLSLSNEDEYNEFYKIQNVLDTSIEENVTKSKRKLTNKSEKT